MKEYMTSIIVVFFPPVCIFTIISSPSLANSLHLQYLTISVENLHEYHVGVGTILVSILFKLHWIDT